MRGSFFNQIFINQNHRMSKAGGKPKGGKAGRRGKNHTTAPGAKDLLLKEPGQEYAQANKMLGSGNIEAYCFDGKTRLCHVRGKMAKKVWINLGDIILIGLRDFQDNKADIIGKYTPEEVRQLRKLGELPEGVGVASERKQEQMPDEELVQFDQAAPGLPSTASSSSEGEANSLDLPEIDDL